MRLSCGARGYDSVKELGQPLPTERTLHRHLEGYKFTPGLLEDIMASLALKVANTPTSNDLLTEKSVPSVSSYEDPSHVLVTRPSFMTSTAHDTPKPLDSMPATSPYAMKFTKAANSAPP
ncbi:hypothetical protein HPB51_024321 [Rhipicephalus microplus]|uniref:Uncharacterized protein n=1 Tax=Rhipicephalus microplus TaxID=6941 RepID=A0A9J6DXP9_RHIMP|nr:hypothetical protein HPB51_024321 [Rhipicephalus microplus]